MKKFLLIFLFVGILLAFSLTFVLFFFVQKKTVVHPFFVTANDTNFYLHGKLFQSIGVNRYNVMTLGGDPFIGCGGVFTDADLSVWFSELHQIGVTSVRFWIFQSFTKSGSNMTRFNYLLSLAQQYNIKLIPVFENQWKDCTQGGEKDTSWYQKGYLSPYGGYPLSLKEYIKKIVSEYKDNPNIFMWQIMNEAQSSDNTALYNFAKDVSSYIKSLDTNHLVSIGALTNGQVNTLLYRNIFSLPSIDVLEYHDYENESNSFPNDLFTRMEYAQLLHKPLFIGESGISLDTFSQQQRASDLSNKIGAYFENHGTTYMIWSYRDARTGEKSYDFTLTDPLSNVIQKYSHILQSGKSVASQVSPIPVQFKLGGLHLSEYCKTIHRNGATLVNGIWYCGKSTPVNLSVACAWQYTNKKAFAVEDYANNPYSLSCYIATSSSLF